ncbi:MAG: GGDEF domain-containing protein [Gammaproteobacteria bacterium]|nr:GGDEF domain-containing protein [Gammaproteobacteria bacterium]
MRHLPFLLALCLGLAAPSRAPAEHTAPDWLALEYRIIDDPQAVMAQLERLPPGGAEQAVMISLLKASALASLERYPELLPVVETGLRQAQVLKRPDLEVRLLTFRAESQTLGGDQAGAEATLKQASALLIGTQDGRAMADLEMQYGRHFELQNRLAEAMQHYSSAYDRYAQLERKDLMGAVQSSIGSIYDRMGESAKAIEAYERTLALQAGSNRLNRAITLYNLGVSYRDLQRYDRAEASLREARGLSRELGDTVGVAYADYQLGYLLIARDGRRAREALPLLMAALPVFQESKNLPMSFLVQLGLARAHALLGDKKALEHLAEADKSRAGLSEERDLNFLHRASEIHAALGDAGKAYATLAQAWELNEKLQKTSNRKLTEEIQARFEVDRREKENQLLRAEQALQQALQQAQWDQQASERWLWGLALSLALFLLAGGALFLRAQMRQKRLFADLALRDELTGAHNRRAILEYAQRRFDEAAQGGGQLCLALLDLDHFKSINDRYGHEGGDAVLKAFAELALAALRESDWLGRFGGEEWLLVMPGAGAEQAEKVFARLRERLQAAQLLAQAPEFRLAFSMGIAELKPGDRQLKPVLARADAALYAAKRAGRDRYVRAGKGQ